MHDTLFTRAAMRQIAALCVIVIAHAINYSVPFTVGVYMIRFYLDGGGAVAAAVPLPDAAPSVPALRRLLSISPTTQHTGIGDPQRMGISGKFRREVANVNETLLSRYSTTWMSAAGGATHLQRMLSGQDSSQVTQAAHADKEKLVGTLSGLLSAGFSLAQFFTAYFWGRASDRIGRKAVLLIAQVTSAISIFLMGISPTFALAFAARFVGGLFNATTGIHKAVTADSFTPQQQAHVMGFTSASWGVGSIVGPVVGGLLSQPCQQFPLPASLCTADAVLVRFPFILPCGVTALIALIAVGTTLAWLQPPPRSADGTAPSAKTPSARAAAAAHGGGSSQAALGLRAVWALHKGWLSLCERDAAEAEIQHAGTQPQVELISVGQEDDGRLVRCADPQKRNLRDSAKERSTELHEFGKPSGEESPPSSEPGAHPDPCEHAVGLARDVAADDERGIRLDAVPAAGSPHAVRKAAGWDDSGHAEDEERVAFLSDFQNSVENAESAGTSSGRAGDDRSDGQQSPGSDVEDPHRPWWTIRTLRVRLMGYGALSFLSCLMGESLPVYASTPMEFGGLGMSSVRLAVPFAIGAACLMLQSTVIYPRLNARFGPIRCLRAGCLGLLPASVAFPLVLYIAQAAPAAGYVAFIVVYGLQSMFTVTSFTSSSLMINEACPRTQIGAVHGCGHMFGSLTRAIGPAIGGSLWSLVISLGVTGAQFIPFAFVFIVALATLCLYSYI